RERSAADRRREVIRLTAAGRDAYELLDSRSAAEIGGLLEPLDSAQQGRLLAAMGAIREILDGSEPPAEAVTLREPGHGDYGWIVQRHGAIYADEFGWDEGFEALVAQIVSAFAEHHDPDRERAWIADVDGH